MSYLNKIENDWRADKITRNEFIELKKAYNEASPKEKEAMEQARDMGVYGRVRNESTAKTAEQKTLEAIQKNTKTMVYILEFFLFLTIMGILLYISIIFSIADAM